MTANLYKLSNNPVRGSTFSFEMVLYQQADTKLIQTSVTLAAGDVVVYKDGVLDGNIDALPVEIGTSGILTVALSVDEMTADRIAIKFSDAAGAQWCSAMVFLSTTQAAAVGTSDYGGGAVASVTGDVGGDVAGSVLGDVEGDLYGDVQKDVFGSVLGKVLGGGVYPLTDTGVQAQLPDDGITAAKLAASAVTEIQSGLSTLTAAQVWAYATRTLSSLSDLLSSISAAVWTYAIRTLNQAAGSVIAAVTGKTVTQYRDSSIYFQLTGLGSLAGRTKLYLTVKRDLDDEDSQALLQWEETAGLKYINGAAATAGDGSLTVDDATLGNITVKALAAVAAELTRGNFKYDVKIVRAGDPAVYPLSEGVFTVKATATRARA